MVIALTTPMTIPSPALAIADQIRRNGLGALYSGTVASAIPIGTRGRRSFGCVRGVREIALTLLRQPANTRAAMASPAIQPAAVVRSVTDTTIPIVLITPPQRWWAWVLASVGLVGLVAVAASALIPSQIVATTENLRLEQQQPAPYARIPAAAESVNDRIVYGNDLPDDVEVFETGSDFFFVTVSQPPQSVLSWLVGSDEPVVDLLTDEARNGRLTESQNRQISLQQMRTATQEAEFVALTAAGYEPTINPGAVVVEDLLCRVVAEDEFNCAEEFPAAEVLEPADTILEISGEPITSLEELSAALSEAAPGDVLPVKIDRPDVGVLDVEVELSSDPTDPTRTIVGFRPFDTRTVDLPFDVSIDTQAVGGPSAGLSFTLALIDELTAGELTGGRDIAVTGTISLDGTVGPIGGLEQKVSAVHQHGVEVFLIPASQFELIDLEPGEPDDGACRWECLLAAGDGEVVLIPVATLDEALSVLETLGGDPVEPATS
jgi:Lon-like protease